MKFKKIIIISCLILAILTIGSVNAIDNNKTTEIINLEDIPDSTINKVDDEIMSLETDDGFLKESNLDIYKKSVMDDDVHSTKEITFTSSKSSYFCYYGEGFDLDYEFSQYSDDGDNTDSKIEIRIYDGTYCKKSYDIVDKTGMPHSFSIESSTYVNCQNIKVGTHKLEAYIDGQYAFTKNLIIKQVPVGYDGYGYASAQYKKNTFYKIEIFNKKSYEPVKNTYFKVKIYTGSKYKTYKIKSVMFEECSWIKIPTKNLKVGAHKIIITPYTNSYSGTFKSKITIYKVGNSVKKTSTTNKKTTQKKKVASKYKIVTIKAKKQYTTKKVGKFKIQTIIFDMWRSYIGHYKYVDTFLYKNGKLVPNTKYYTKYKINGKWTNWKKNQVNIGTSHHRYPVYTNIRTATVKIKFHK